MMTFFHSLMDRRPHSSLRTSTASEGRTARTTRLQRDRHGSTAASLEARRSNARLHRFLAALCAGLTVFATLQCVRAAIATQPIVVAVRNVAKGTAITREDVELREAPSDGSLSNAFHTLDDAVGLIAQVGIGAHDVLMSGMARASPVVPQGHTSIEVRLASVAGGLIPGDKVTLSSATMTDAEMQSGTPNVADMPNGTETPSGMANDMPDGGVDAQLRTICAEALLTGKPAKDAQGNTIAVFAMPTNEAAVVLRVQEYSAVIATIN
ncbi:SAF domain-containing protein [Bifidobacterium adolescentis]|uniref:SAF domain-containing protein n=1 Tax=Bifidobacterium adolescentis TaxID=1680 RepID=UPI0022E1751A|nr:SAF domain-containing protein [Bifidobacterium adolescentis]